ncbi:MAG: helix-turn-helix transcriptional regulator [Eggerthellaceae bacterium]|nr:helix-turn-helix transcriptional regulator [Eggerthellaceae bacterium]
MQQVKTAQRHDIDYQCDIRHQIFMAMECLGGDKPLESIGVKDICNEAHISRQTFYRYFPNKHAIAEWHMNNLFMAGTYQIGRIFPWYEGHLITISGIARTLDFCNLYLVDDSLAEFGERAHGQNIRETLLAYRGIEVDQKLNLQIDGFVRAQTFAIQSWVKGDADLTPAELAETIVTMVPSPLFDLLNDPAFL